MADASATFAIEIGETGASDVAGQLEALKASILADTASLREMKGALTNLKAGSSIDISSFKALNEQITTLKSKLGASQAQFINSGGTFSKTAVEAEKVPAPLAEAGEASEGASVNLQSMGRSLGKLGGPLGEAGQKGFALANAFKKLGALGPAGIIAAVVVLVVALSVAMIAGAIAIAKWAVGLADTNRSAKLAAEGVAATSKGLKDLATLLPSIAAKTGLSNDEITKLGEELDAAGVPAKQMGSALEALATATAGGASQAFITKLKSELAATGAVSADTAAKLAKLKEIAAAKLLSLDAQSAKFHDNISKLFGGLKIEGLLQGLQKLIGLFDANTSTGKALKTVFEALFQPLIDGATAAIPYIAAAFQQLVIWGLKAYIALAPFKGEIKLLAQIIGGLLLAAILAIGAAVVIAFAPIAIVVGAVVGAFYLVIKIVQGVVGAFGAAYNFIAGLTWADVGKAIVDVLFAPLVAAKAVWSALTSIDWSAIGSAIMGAFSSAYDYLASIDLGSIGTAMITGLANAISGAAGAVIGAISGVVGGAIAEAKSILGIHSPSRVFAEIGMHTAGGMAGGIDDGAGDVASSSAAMAGGAAAAASSGPGGSASKGGATVNLTINVSGGADASLAQRVRDAVLEALEQAGLAGGEVHA